MLLIYESGRVRIMMQEDQLLIEAGNEPRIFIIIEGMMLQCIPAARPPVRSYKR